MPNTLRRKPSRLLRKARFVLLFAEQAIQLYIKYILAKEFGDYPKTHKISLLFEELSKITEDAMSFYEKYAEYLGLLEEANITTRYFGKEYSHKSAEKVLEVIGEFKEVFGSRLVSVYVFGSVIEGKDKPMSDVDVAVVLRDSAGEEERMRLYKKVRKNFGLHPFEIHIVTVLG